MLKTKYMKSIFKTLQPYTTDKTTFHFYFPKAGDFRHFPSMISKDQVVVATGGQNTLKVESHKRILKV